MGMPVLGYEVRVVDEAGRDVPPGTVGELIVRGEPGVSLMKGYLGNPEATAAALRDGWLWSGDRAVVDEDGYFHFVDRARDILKRAGENVSASEVEDTIRQHPGVFDAAVVGVPDPLRDQAIKAYVVPRPAASPAAEELIAWCRARLAPFKVPEQIEFRASLPRTAVGKIQKHLL
jgi:crotonobetaine/carnitine-CoA ligase